MRVLALVAAVVVCTGSEGASVALPKNFIFFAHERQRIAEPSFLDHAQIAGAQLKYTWRELEPERDR